MKASRLPGGPRIAAVVFVIVALAGAGGWSLLHRSQASDHALTASGTIETRVVDLASDLGGRALEVLAEEGQSVQAGQVLVKLDDAALQAQYAQAQAALEAAQANYDLLAAGPTAEQLRQANDAVISATAAYSRTLESVRQADVAAARAALAAANANYDKVKAGPAKEDYALAEANLRSAEAALRQAQAAYDAARARNPGGISADPSSFALEKATNDYNAAKAIYDSLSRPPDQAALSAAYQQVAAATAQLDRLQGPAQALEARQAQAQADSAQSQLAALKAGARPEQLAAARAQVEAAQAALEALQAQLPRYSLTAPFDGVLLGLDIQPGETAVPGTPVLVVGDLSRLRVETTDLSERDVPQVELGQPVTVVVKALNQQVAGRVSAIAPLAGTLGGDVVYKATIDLDTMPKGLRAGMSVEVHFGAEAQ